MIRWRGKTAIDNLIAREVTLQDSRYMYFGDADDVSVRWTGSVLEILPVADDTGAINIGNGTLNIDVKVFLGAAADYVVLDVGNKALELHGAVELDLSGITLTPDMNRTYRAWHVGNRVTEKDITMVAAANQDLDPIQINLNIIGANPSGTSTVNLSWMNITHDTTAMANLRLKCADWNIVVGKSVQDVYVYQGEIDFNAAGIVVGGEAAVMGLVMNAGSNAVSGNLRGLIISMQGSGSYASVVGLEIRTTCGDVLGHGCSEAIRIAGTPLPVVGIAMGNQTNNNEGPQNAFFFPSTGSPDTGPWSAVNATGDSGKIAIKIGASTRYINVYTS